jgi:hypothetical protein
MRLPTITIKPVQISLTEAEILADLAYPARPQTLAGESGGRR